MVIFGLKIGTSALHLSLSRISKGLSTHEMRDNSRQVGQFLTLSGVEEALQPCLRQFRWLTERSVCSAMV